MHNNKFFTSPDVDDDSDEYQSEFVFTITVTPLHRAREK